MLCPLELASADPVCCGFSPCTSGPLPLLWHLAAISKWGLVDPTHLFKPTISQSSRSLGTLGIGYPGTGVASSTERGPALIAEVVVGQRPLTLQGGRGRTSEASLASKAVLRLPYLRRMWLKLLSLVLAMISVVKTGWLWTLQGSSDFEKWSLKSHSPKKSNSHFEIGIRKEEKQGSRNTWERGEVLALIIWEQRTHKAWRLQSYYWLWWEEMLCGNSALSSGQFYQIPHQLCLFKYSEEERRATCLFPHVHLYLPACW